MAGPINTLAFALYAKFLASGGTCDSLMMVECWPAVCRQWPEGPGMGYYPQADPPSHQGWAGMMGADNLYSMVNHRFPQWHPLLWDWKGTHRDLSKNQRGSMWACQKNIRKALTMKQDQFKEMSSTAVMPFNEPIEAIDYNKNKGRLGLSSHSEKIRVCHLEKNGAKNFSGDSYFWFSVVMSRDGPHVMEWELEWSQGGERRNPPICSIYREGGKPCHIWVGIWGRVSVCDCAKRGSWHRGIRVSKLAATGVDNWSKVLKSSMCVIHNHEHRVTVLTVTFQWQCILQCQSKMVAGRQSHQGVWPIWISSYVAIRIVFCLPH